MTFLAPAFLMAAALVAAGVVAIHFIVTREPRLVPLPTARFAPARPVRARAKAMKPQDLLLLLLRVLLVLAVGAALARPVLQPPKRDLARILVVDRSRAVGSIDEVADSARALYREGDAVVLVDSAATVVTLAGNDSLGTLVRAPRRGSLTAGLIAALRTATDMRQRADSFEVAVISPFVAESIDEATDSVRALWPGAVRLVRVAPRTDSARATVAAIAGPSDDPLRLALPARPAGATSRIVRTAPGVALAAADTAWAQAGARTLVHWPTGGATGIADALPSGWRARAAADTIGAVIAGEAVVVAPFVRRAAYQPADAAPARVVARWVDGAPAAVETTHGAGCIRTVMIDVPERGDLVLQPRFARLVAALAGPCGGGADLAPVSDARLAALAGAAGTVRASAIAAPETVETPLVPWLLGAALVFAALAFLLGRRIGGAAADAVPA